MKGIETKYLLEMILVVVIILILYIIVVNPSLIFAKGSGQQISFREFCFHWSILGYRTDSDTITVGTYTYYIKSYCDAAGAVGTNACIRMCKGEA